MKTMDFKIWVKSIDRMSRSQRDKLRERIARKIGADTAVTLIEQSVNDESVCPHCMSTKLYRWGKVCELQRYRCRQCNRTFNGSVAKNYFWPKVNLKSVQKQLTEKSRL